MPEENKSIFTAKSTTLRVFAGGASVIMAFGVVPAAASAAAGALIGSGTVVAIGAGVHASAQAFGVAWRLAPVVMYVSNKAVIGLVNATSMVTSEVVDRMRAGDAAPVEPRQLAADDMSISHRLPSEQIIRRTRSI